jgi:hypothetical protein
MNENLADMVKEAECPPTVFSEADLDLPVEQEETVETATQEAASQDHEVDEPELHVIPITTMTEWFERSCNTLENINQVKVAIRGIDAEETLIMAVKDNSGEQDENGNDKRILRVFDNANITPVLNLGPLMMEVYNNGFQIVYHVGDIFIKTYGVRTGLICVLCNNVNNMLIPYSVIRLKKKDSELTYPIKHPEVSADVLSADADLESLQLLYKQSAKAVDELSTMESVIKWLTDRQKTVTDINHHLQIDNVIIEMLK